MERYGSAYAALWWVPAGHVPTLDEGLERLALLERVGPTRDAFTFKRRFAPPDADIEVAADERDVCRA